MAKKHFNISEIVVKGRGSDYEKRLIVQRLWKRKSFDSSFSMY